MRHLFIRPSRTRWKAGAAAALALAVALPAWALFKVVGPDGRVTYTDRPPAAAGGDKVAPLRASESPAPAPAAALPAELRQPMARHPVTLYTSTDCVPCDSARQLLTQRGVPFAERRVISNEDIRAFEQLSGGRTMPAVAIGAQFLKGLDTAAWTSYLDAAGYPRESKMPRGWKPPAATPLVDPVAAPADAASPAGNATAPAAAPSPAAAPAPRGNPGNIRF